MSKEGSLKDVKIGAILSYSVIILNTIYGLVIIPYILYYLGDIEYGVYRSIASLSSAISILDLGIGGMITRYVASYKAKKLDEKISTLLSMAFGEGLILILIVASVCIVLYMLIPTIYANGLSTEQIALAQRLFFVLAANLCLQIFDNLLSGIIQGYNKFSVTNSMQFIRLLFRVALTFALLRIIPKALVLVLIDLALTVIVVLAKILYITRSLELVINIKLKGWDGELFVESFKYTSLLFLTSIAAQVNNNLDNVVIGASIGAASVAVYSIGLSIFGMFESLSTSISGVMLPTVTNVLVNDRGGTEIERLIIRVGRIQFMLLGSAFAGFIAIGNHFLYLWLGEGFEDVYIIVIILMAPSLLELCVNVCLSILRAKNILWFRTAILTASTLLNIVITVVGVKLFGYFAAAVGTAISFLVGSVVVMNVYYYKVLNLKMLKIYISIFHRTWICILISAIITKLLSLFIKENWLSFALCIAVYIIVFLVLMMTFGFSEIEKGQIKRLKNKVIKEK